MNYRRSLFIVFLFFIILVMLFEINWKVSGGHVDLPDMSYAEITGTPTAMSFLPIIQRNGSTLTPTPSATATATATGSPTATPTATQVPVTGNIIINSIFYDGSGEYEKDEYVEIINLDTHYVRMANWTLRDIENHVFTFPDFILKNGDACRVYTNQTLSDGCGLSFNIPYAIWNNTGDCAYLDDASMTQVDTYCYP